MATVFISYSRADLDFADRLALELERLFGREGIWIDRQSIHLTADWWEEIKRGIESADNFVLIMSPDSIASPVCHLEVEFARSLGKRILPLAHRPFERDTAAKAAMNRVATDSYVNALLGDRNPMSLFNANWLVISRFNWIPFPYDAKSDQRDQVESDFIRQFASLRQALATDLVHVRQHTRLTMRAREWLENGRSAALLLNGDDITNAEEWLTGWERDKAEKAARSEHPIQPEPTDDIRAFIADSRQAERQRRAALDALEQRAQTAQHRARRNSLLAGVTGVIGAAVLIAALVIGGALSQQVGDAQATLTPIPRTLTEAAVALGGAQDAVARANRTLTPIPPTLTQAARSLDLAQAQVQDANATVTPIQATLQAIEVEIDRIEATGTRIVRQVETAIAAQGDFVSQQLGSEAARLLQLDQNAQAAALLTLYALDRAYSPQADAALTTALTRLHPVWHRPNILLPELGLHQMTYSPDGQHIALGMNDGWAIYGWQNNESVGFTALEGGANALTYSPDGRWLVVLDDSAGYQLLIYDTATYTLARTFALEAGFGTSLAFSPDGRYLALDGSSILIYDWETLELVQSLRTLDDMVVFSPDGESLLTFDSVGDANAAVSVFDLGSAAIRLTLPNQVRGAYSPDARHIVTSDLNGLVTIWDAETGAYQWEARGHLGGVETIDFHPSGRWFATASEDGSARLWDMQARAEVTQARFQDGVSSGSRGALRTTFSPDGQHWLIAAQEDEIALTAFDVALLTQHYDTTIRYMELYRTDQLFTLPGSAGVLMLEANPAAPLDPNLIRLDWATGQLHRVTHMLGWIDAASSLQSLAVSPDGRWAAVNQYETLRIYEIATGRLMRDWRSTDQPIRDIAFSPDGDTLAYTIDEAIHLLDLTTNTLAGRLDEASIEDWAQVAFSADGRFLAGSDGFSRIALFDHASGQMRHTVQTFSRTDERLLYDIEFSPDGAFLAAAAQEPTVYIWNTANGSPAGRLVGHTGSVVAVDYSPDGRWILTGSLDGSVRLWRSSDNALIRTLVSRDAAVAGVSFSDDGTEVYASYQDGAVLRRGIIAADIADLTAFACTRLTRQLSDLERSRYLSGESDDPCLVQDEFTLLPALPARQILPATWFTAAIYPQGLDFHPLDIPVREEDWASILLRSSQEIGEFGGDIAMALTLNAERNMLLTLTDAGDRTLLIGQSRVADGFTVAAAAEQLGAQVRTLSGYPALVLEPQPGASLILMVVDEVLLGMLSIDSTTDDALTTATALLDAMLAPYASQAPEPVDPILTPTSGPTTTLLPRLGTPTAAPTRTPFPTATLADSAAARFDQGMALVRRGGDERALPLLRGAVDLEPGNAVYQTAYVSLLNRLSRFDEALAVADAALLRIPDHAPLLVGRGTALSWLNRHEEALAMFERALAIEPATDTRQRIANELYALGRYDESAAMLDLIAQVSADNPDYHNLRALLAAAAGDRSAALVALTRAIDLDSERVEFIRTRGSVYFEDGQYDAALADYLRVDEFTTTRRSADQTATDFYNIAWAYLHLNNFRRAEHYIGLALIWEEAADLYNAEGLILLYGGDADAALRSFDAALERDPDFANAWLGNGLAHLLRGELDLADTAWSEFAGRDDTGTQLVWSGVTALLRADGAAAQEAFAAYQVAAIALAQYGEVYPLRAQALLQVIEGDVDAAQASYQQAIALLPGAHNWVYPRLYLRVLASLFPDRSDIAMMIPFLDQSLGMAVETAEPADTPETLTDGLVSYPVLAGFSAAAARDDSGGELSQVWALPQFVTDFELDAALVNPDREGLSGYAILFRTSPLDDIGATFALLIDDQQWTVSVINDDQSAATLAEGANSLFSLAPGARNRLRLQAVGARGQLWMNETFMGSFDLSARLGSGVIGIIGIVTPDVPSFAVEDVTLTAFGAVAPTPTATPDQVRAVQPGDNRGVLAIGGRQQWTLDGLAGDTITLEVIADRSVGDTPYDQALRDGLLDTELYVFQPDGTLGWIAVDVASGQTNALLTITLPETGRYVLEVFSLSNLMGGGYTLRLSQ